MTTIGNNDTSTSRQSMRLRAAWMYHIEGLTQSQIADRLGVGRVTVVRLLSDARNRNEVRINIVGQLSECFQLGKELEKKFDIQEVIVVPSSEPQGDANVVIGAALGDCVSKLVRPSMTLGVGWGRTLHHSLSNMVQQNVSDLEVISLVGGITKARAVNPAEFAWQFSNLLGAESYLLTAPAFVDSSETKTALIERCGLDEVFAKASKMDACLLSVAPITQSATTFKYHLLTETERVSLIEAGAVGDVLCNFFNDKGQLLDHEVNRRVMSIPIETILRVPIRILASGGREKDASLLGGIKLLRPTVFITDENSAARLLQNS